MLQLSKGYTIYEPERLHEEYEVTNDTILTANVGVEKMEKVFQHFISMHDEPFTILMVAHRKNALLFWKNTEISLSMME